MGEAGDPAGVLEGGGVEEFAEGEQGFVAGDDGHLYAAAWTGATNDDKEKALVFATRLIDSQFQFNGWRAHDEQALQWPRERCPDPDKGLVTISVLVPFLGTFVDADLIPKALLDATCEMARELLIADRTASPPGEGLHSSYTAHMVSGGVSDISNVAYDKGDTRPVISRVTEAMLAKFGAAIKSGGGAVRLMRT